MNKRTKASAVICAFLAAVFYAISTPFSKVLLNNVAPTFMAAFLYLGAGIGVGIMYLFNVKKEEAAERLTKSDLPYTLGMIALDIAAPIFLMVGKWRKTDRIVFYCAGIYGCRYCICGA